VKPGGATAKSLPQLEPLKLNKGGSLFFLWVVTLCAFLGSCRNQPEKRLSDRQIHEVTEELVQESAQAGLSATAIKIAHVQGADEIHISLKGNEDLLFRLRRRIESVATKNRLTVEAPATKGGATRFFLKSDRTITHRIEIQIVGTPQQAGPSANAQRAPAKLAILLDDLGSDLAAANHIFALNVPVTVAVLPFHTHSQQIAREAKNRGCEVMLHLPMQSLANEAPEQDELRPGLSSNQVEMLVTKMLNAVPEATGVNNHQGSQATANNTLMEELMPVLKNAGVFYVDSRTTAATVAYETAKREGVKAAFRNVPFLDDVQSEVAVRKQLQLAIRLANEKGEAIAIGHPHTQTLAALREMIPEMKRQGVQLVLVSELVH
jgi:polysaccharide deacetylase 2 family uncharacterized protein YibQ